MQKQIFRKTGLSKILFLILMVLFIGIIGNILYFKTKKESKLLPPVPSPTISPSTVPSISAEAILSKSLITPEDIVVEKIDITPQVPPYDLPLNLGEVANFQKFSEKIKLSSKALSLLANNGFVVIPTPKDIAETPVYLGRSGQKSYPKDDFTAYYKLLKDKDLPIFITTDSLLHYYHIFFDTTLMKLERDLFYDDLWQMSKEFFDDALWQYNNTFGDLKEAAKRNVAYFSVALELLKPKSNQIATKENIEKEFDCYGSPESCQRIIAELLPEGKTFNFFNAEESKKYTFQTPDFVKDLVKKEIELIEKHESWEKSPIFIYEEDYSQYVPRGHYTKSEKLKNYFKAMMWYGRMTALVKGSPELKENESKCAGGLDGIISEYDAKVQTLQASLIANKFSQSKSIQERWTRIYAITSFFVGFSDDLGPYEYSAALKSLFEGEIKSKELEEKYPKIKEVLLNLPYKPKIYSGLGNCELVTPDPPLSDEEIEELIAQAKKLLEETKGFRLMGQRFTVDSWIFSEIVSPYSGEYTGKRTPRPFTWVKTQRGREVRGFPRGLDLMALLGSKRAKEILKELGDTEYSHYEKKFNELKKEIDSLPLETWFQNLYWNWLYVLKSLLGEFGKGYPTFMQTKAWQDKELTTALASWTELRHDTILYVKQSYTMAEMGGEFEPPIVGYVEPVPEFYARLLSLTKMTNEGLKKLIPKDELEKLKIEHALNEFSEILTKLLEISKKELENKPLTEEEYLFIESFGSHSEALIEIIAGGETELEEKIDPDILKTTLIADVHTEGNTRQVLEEGVGYIKTLIVAYKLPQGHILIGVGPVFSYYEFKQPMKNRLTDEAWREMLKNNPPPEPEWVKNFSE